MPLPLPKFARRVQQMARRVSSQQERRLYKGRLTRRTYRIPPAERGGLAIEMRPNRQGLTEITHYPVPQSDELAVQVRFLKDSRQHVAMPPSDQAPPRGSWTRSQFHAGQGGESDDEQHGI